MLDQKEERQYERLRKLGQELHIPLPEAFWTLEVFDKDGKLIQRHRQRSHSWVRNAYNLLLSQLASKNLDDAGVFEAGKLSIKDTAGAIKDGDYGATIGLSSNYESSGNGYRCAAGSNLHGIQVGSGTNAESIEDYVLQTLIADGVGVGQLSYVLSEAPATAWSAPTFTILWVRYFNNNSGGNVDVNEVALTTKGSAQNATATFLMSRDKLPATVTVPDTGQLKVTYTIQLTYPA